MQRGIEPQRVGKKNEGKERWKEKAPRDSTKFPRAMFYLPAASCARVKARIHRHRPKIQPSKVAGVRLALGVYKGPSPVTANSYSHPYAATPDAYRLAKGS